MLFQTSIENLKQIYNIFLISSSSYRSFFVKYGVNILFNILYAHVRNFFVIYFLLSQSIIRDYKLNYLTNKRL